MEDSRSQAGQLASSVTLTDFWLFLSPRHTSFVPFLVQLNSGARQDRPGLDYCRSARKVAAIPHGYRSSLILSYIQCSTANRVKTTSITVPLHSFALLQPCESQAVHPRIRAFSHNPPARLSEVLALPEPIPILPSSTSQPTPKCYTSLPCPSLTGQERRRSLLELPLEEP
jgi:hypothetical protein